MNRKLTISIDGAVYDGLHALIGRGNIGKFLENLARPFVIEDTLAASYKAMAADETRERDADEWTDAMTPTLDDEAW
ncbi:MAG TPA: hypothetical protein VHC22_34340 [Pirellulales bacterium]|nr:hypothetical protein [Pirellulales bacterium]